MRRRDLLRMVLAVPAGLVAIPAARLLSVPASTAVRTFTDVRLLSISPMPDPEAVLTAKALRALRDQLDAVYTPPRFIMSQRAIRDLVAMAEADGEWIPPLASIHRP